MLHKPQGHEDMIKGMDLRAANIKGKFSGQEIRRLDYAISLLWILLVTRNEYCAVQQPIRLRKRQAMNNFSNNSVHHNNPLCP